MNGKEGAWIIQMNMSGPNHIDESEELSDKEQKIYYTYPKEVRKKIGAIRAKHSKPMLAMTLDFHGLHICSTNQSNDIKKMIAKADEEMKNLSPELYANVTLIPIDLQEVKKGELYNQVLTAIKYKILSNIIDRLDIKSKQLPKNSQDALIRMIERLRAVNILGDQEIDQRLDDIRDKILNEDLETIRKELQSELKTLVSQRGAYIEL